METLTNKDLAFDLIDSLNLIHDFYIQIGKKEKLLASKLILNLRDNLYNNHFWKNDGFELTGVKEGDLEKTKIALTKIYNEFIRYTLLI